MPNTPGKTVYFPTVQRCTKGVIRWIEIPKQGAGRAGASGARRSSSSSRVATTTRPHAVRATCTHHCGRRAVALGSPRRRRSWRRRGASGFRSTVTAIAPASSEIDARDPRLRRPTRAPQRDGKAASSSSATRVSRTSPFATAASTATPARPPRISTTTATGSVALPANADAKARTGVGGGRRRARTYDWHDHRIHWMSTTLPPTVEAAEGQAAPRLRLDRSGAPRRQAARHRRLARLPASSGQDSEAADRHPRPRRRRRWRRRLAPSSPRTRRLRSTPVHARRPVPTQRGRRAGTDSPLLLLPESCSGVGGEAVDDQDVDREDRHRPPGYSSRKNSWPTAFTPATAIPNQRASSLPLMREKARAGTRPRGPSRSSPRC